MPIATGIVTGGGGGGVNSVGFNTPLHNVGTSTDVIGALIPGTEDGQVLSWNALTSRWEPTVLETPLKTPVPTTGTADPASGATPIIGDDADRYGLNLYNASADTLIHFVLGTSAGVGTLAYDVNPGDNKTITFRWTGSVTAYTDASSADYVVTEYKR